MLIGIGLKLLSTIAFTLMNGLIRGESNQVPVGELVFFRSLLALFVLIGWLHARGEFPAAIHTKRPFGHLLRGLIGSGGMFFGFAALALIPLPDVTAIGFTTPLIGVALAALILKEKVHIYRWSAVGVGFLGVLVMLHDQIGGDVETSARTLGSGFALLGAICSAAAMTQTRRLTQTEQTGAIVFYFSLLTTLMGMISFALPLLWPAGTLASSFMKTQIWTMPDAYGLLRLCAIGMIGGAAQILMTQSYRLADASVVAAFDYTSMIWASLLGYLAFGDLPSSAIVSGAGIVAFSGIFVLWREHRLGQLRLPTRRMGLD